MPSEGPGRLVSESELPGSLASRENLAEPPQVLGHDVGVGVIAIAVSHRGVGPILSVPVLVDEQEEHALSGEGE